MRTGEEPPLRVPEIGLIKPAHLMEARRKLLDRGELMTEQPKPMFLR